MELELFSRGSSASSFFEEGVVAVLTIRNLDEATKARLRIRAAHNGRSMEAEAREILHRAVGAGPDADVPSGLGTRISRMFAEVGGVDLTIPEDLPPRPVPGLEDWGRDDEPR
ncbi:FitA-like ribbon-helix-helix domain-containing protein [Pseudoxanthobacter sp. M-2]|uniref:FitA-like ribbon-helix-helix domain-containing protein n=1 Tax=Pseudoxanthobacter sp. M-2 TaxID=3078754 RepID=UPI0038FC673C